MIETLLTVPPRMAEYLQSSSNGKTLLSRLAWPRGSQVFATSDPAGKQLGSGGGTVHLLWKAWKNSGNPSFSNWLNSSQKLVLHAGGESRRLPAYASIGKTFVPLPMMTSLEGQRFDQMLCDFQIPSYSQALLEAGRNAAVMVTSGDVLLEFNALEIPAVTADITGIGMRVSAEVAQHFGVFFVRNQARESRTGAREISFFLQKPSVEEINQRGLAHDYYVDTGMWLLSPRAVAMIFEKCAWHGDEVGFSTPDGLPSSLDLYSEIGALLGHPDAGFTAGVIPLENAKFHHLGSSRQLFESLYDLQAGQHSQQRRFISAAKSESIVTTHKRPVWADGVLSTQPLNAQGANLITGLPLGSSITRLPDNLCVDVTPVDADQYCLRVYHLDDSGRGRMLCGQNAGPWLAARGFHPNEGDIFQIPVYPVLTATEITQDWIDWFIDAAPKSLEAKEYLSAKEIPRRINLDRYFDLRIDGYKEYVTEFFHSFLQKNAQPDCAQDFKVLADFIESRLPELKNWILENREAMTATLYKIEHRTRFEFFLQSLGAPGSPFQLLKERILESREPGKHPPRLGLKEDQIVWARSPVRIDLAGGWTDTPPFCFERGGSVLNLAVLLNGQPPVQVFVRPTREKVLKINSIDLGTSITISTHEELVGYESPDSSFGLATAALALAGFDPKFQTVKKYPDLKTHLEEFGAGLELTLLCAVPKGSGLGTSSILASTLLAALNRACRLDWDRIELYQQVLVMEQLLTTGGGWQDQAGALFHGMKLIQTEPGLGQIPYVRYLPDDLISTQANRTWLLYYTGVTRLAKHILADIVSNMFLGKQETGRILEGIRANSKIVFDALQAADWEQVVRGIQRSWFLNTTLDSGTSNPQIQAILDQCAGELDAWKLPGAGGGGYLLLCCRDEQAARRIRTRLESNPPNPRARFVEFTIAETGLEVSVS